MSKSYKRKKEYSNADKFEYHSTRRFKKNIDPIKKQYSIGWLTGYDLKSSQSSFIKLQNAYAKGVAIGYKSKHKNK